MPGDMQILTQRNGQEALYRKCDVRLQFASTPRQDNNVGTRHHVLRAAREGAIFAGPPFTDLDPAHSEAECLTARAGLIGCSASF
jgi:hypothetical protein